MAGYLFVHFIGEENNGEQVYYSVSQDGLHWKDLNNGRPVLCSNIGEKGVRDPFIIRDSNNNKFYLIATDLKIETRKDWESARTRGSRDIIVWESEDLINWSEERACTVGIPEAGCVWAPETIYDEDKEAFFVFWASFVKEPNEAEGKHRIYSAYTKDFRTFTKAEKYIEREKSIIDTTIIKSEGKYYRFTKDETNGMIYQEVGTSLSDGDFKPVHSETLEKLRGLEGPQCYQLPDGKWCLICDQFAVGKGYMPIIIDDLETGKMRVLSEDCYDMGKTKKRHGSVIALTDSEYQALLQRYGAEE